MEVNLAFLTSKFLQMIIWNFVSIAHWIEIMAWDKKSNNHGNFIPISIVSFHYHFLFFLSGSYGISFSISKIVRCEAIFFLSLNIIPKILPYHLISHLSCMLKYAFNIIPSVLMEQLMMILIFIVHTQIYTQIHILFMLTMNNFIHFAKEVKKKERDRKKGWTSLKGFSAFHPFSF